MVQEKLPLVSICMLTYQHEEFILDSIVSILNQDFFDEFELIIADDASSDNTDNIVNSLIKTHPKGKCIKYFKHPINIGMQANSIFILSKCVGKYIAICEGDDYWIDNKKLEKQYNFLIQNPDYKFCSHRIKEYNNSKNIFKEINDKSRDVNYSEFLKNGGCCGLYTCSFFFERDNELIYKVMQDWVLDLDGTDYLILLLYSKKYKKIRILNDIMGVYRIHSSGVWTSRQRGINEILKLRKVNDLIVKNLNFTNKESNLLIASEIKCIYSVCYTKYGFNFFYRNLMRFFKIIFNVLPFSDFKSLIVIKISNFLISKK